LYEITFYSPLQMKLHIPGYTYSYFYKIGSKIVSFITYGSIYSNIWDSSELFSLNRFFYGKNHFRKYWLEIVSFIKKEIIFYKKIVSFLIKETLVFCSFLKKKEGKPINVWNIDSDHLYSQIILYCYYNVEISINEIQLDVWRS